MAMSPKGTVIRIGGRRSVVGRRRPVVGRRRSEDGGQTSARTNPAKARRYLETAAQIRHVVRGALQPLSLLSFVARRDGVIDALAERVDRRADVVLNRLGVFGTACHRLLRVLDLFLQHLVTNRACGFVQLPRGIALIVGK